MADVFKLDNGMDVILEENHAAPVISFHLLVKVGSAMERRSEAGISHVIEHMLFKGTDLRPVGAIAKEVETAGGEINAYTSLDQTVYYINMASRFAERGLAILADAVQNPLFDAADLEREKEVILEEIRRERDSPGHRVCELLFAKSYRSHPYKNPVIGNAETVKSFTRAKIMGFYRRWYAPKNASLIVVGAFSTEKMLREIKKRFRDFRGGAIPRIFFPREPAGRRAGVVLEKNPVEAAYFSIGFHIPGITDRDIPSIDMLSHILGGSESSRLPQSVKEKKRLVNDVQSHAFTPRHPGLFMVSGVTTPEKIEGAVMAVWDEILRLRREPASLREIERSRLNLCSSEIYEKETAGGQAGKYAYFLATAGSHDFEKEYYRALHDVRAEDILCAARRYLSPSNATAVIIHPSGALRRVNAKKIKRHIGIRERACLPAARAWKRAPEPVVHTLQNGVRLVIRENHALPIASLTAVMLGGLRFESRRMNGVNNLLALTITKGTSGMTAVEVAEKIESVAGTVHGFAGRNSFGVKTEFLSDKFDAGFGLFGEILREPGFAASEVQKEKLQVLDAIRQQEDSLSSLAFMEFLAALFPKHPYGLRMLGERDSVKALTRERLAGYYRRIADPREMVISVVGDVSPEDVLKLSEANFRFARGGGRKPPKPEAGLRHTSPVTVERRKKGKEQAHIVTGFLGPRLASKDHYAMIVLNNVLTGQGGRLFLRLRDEMGLAYAVNSTYFAGLEPGFIAIYIGTEPKKVEKALAGIRSELEKIIRKGVGRSELDRSKNYIVGSFELDKQRNSNMADSYAFNLLYGLGISESEKFPEKIRRVGSDDILRVAEKYIALDAPVTAIIRP